MNYPFVSIIIPTYNSEEHVGMCLKSIKQLSYPKDRLEVMVVDGGSSDRTKKIVKSHGINILNNPSKNAAAGRNIGIKNSFGEYIAFTDSDCFVDKSWLSNVIELFRLNDEESLACIGGPNYSPESTKGWSRIIAFSQNTFLGSGGSVQSSFPQKAKFVSSIPNCNAIYKRGIFAKVGYYDNQFKTGQDAELNYRIARNGYNFLYSPDVIVWHHRRSSLKKFSKRMFDYGYSMAFITKKHKRIVRWYSLIPSTFIISLFICPFMILLNPNFILIYSILGILYFTLLIQSALIVLKKYKSKSFLQVPIVLFLQHLAYGFGFIFGLLHLNSR